MRSGPVGVAIVGAGDISRCYVECLRGFEALALHGICNRSGSLGNVVHGLPWRSLNDLLRDPGVELVLNLSNPLEHASTSAAALQAGKHVYSEKPLAHEPAEGRLLQRLAAERGLVLACAPATHLGPAQQTVRDMIDRGELGRIVGGTATVVYGGPDLWHANPAPLFGTAAGPLFDLGVYFVSAFVHWFGPAVRVSGHGRRMHDVRRVHAGPRQGEIFDVTALTHVAGWIEFASGAVVSLTTSFDSPGSGANAIEVYGTEASVALAAGSLGFEAPVTCCRRHATWEPLPAIIDNWCEPWWGIGVVDTAQALRCGTAPRAPADVALHVLDILSALELACHEHRVVAVDSGCAIPPALQAGRIDDNFRALLGASPAACH